MANQAIKHCQADQKERNLFLSFLAEYHSKSTQSTIDVTAVIAAKRLRFERLHHAALRALSLRNHEKCWHIMIHLRKVLEEDEYPDEVVTNNVEEVFLYLDVIIALCAFETQRDLQSCITFCQKHIQIQCVWYPVLLSILTGCFIKLQMDHQAFDIISCGLKFIIDNYTLIVELREKQRREETFFVARLFGDNSPSFNFYTLYAYAKLLRATVHETVQNFGSHFPNEPLAPVIEATEFKHCCIGQLNAILLREMHMTNMAPDYVVDFEVVKSNNKCIGEHVMPHCRLLQVVVNCDGMNACIFVNCFAHVCHFPLASKPQQLHTTAIQTACTVFYSVKRARHCRLTQRYGNSLQSRRLLKTVILSLLAQFQMQLQLESDIALIYVRCFKDSMPECPLMQELEETSARLLAPRNWDGVHLRLTSKHLRNFIRRLADGLTTWRKYIEDVFAYVYAQCNPETESANPAPVPQAVKETQTNYSKFSCRAKQTQTEKQTFDEQYLTKQNSLLTLKVADLEAKIVELTEDKRESTDTLNKTIKSMKKELSQARRIIVEKNKEITHQKYQIEQLQSNISKLNKPYAHVVKPPEDAQKELCNKNAIKEMEKLQMLHAKCTGRNKTLEKQLDDLADEFDEMKERRDALVELKEEQALLYQEKCEDYEYLNSRMECMKTENAKLQHEQEKFEELKKVVHRGSKDFIDGLLEKITQYKVRCERIHQELTYYLYSCTPNINIKQMCDSNQTFLNTMGRQLEKDMHTLSGLKDVFAGDSLDEVTTLNWKGLIVSTEGFCTDLFNQYVQTLNATMTLHSALGNALAENARLINQNISATTAAMMEPDKYYRPHFYQKHPDRESMPLQTLPQASNLGPIGSNRPHTSMSDYQKPKTRTPSPVEIHDPSTKNILSQIANAVNFPSSLAQGNSPLQGSQSFDASQGVIRRPFVNPNPGLRMGLPHTNMPRVDNTMKENYGCRPPATPANFAQPLEHEWNALGAKNREIYMAVKKRCPSALMKDLLGALNGLKNMNINLYKIPMDSIVELVENYIHRQNQLRMRNYETQEPVLSDCTSDEYCSICFEKLNLMPTNTLKCMHIFHDKCIKLWIRQNNVCPICRNFILLE